MIAHHANRLVSEGFKVARSQVLLAKLDVVDTGARCISDSPQQRGALLGIRA